MTLSKTIPVQNLALPGEPFRLAAVDIAAFGGKGGEKFSAPAIERIERFTSPEGRARAAASEWFKACWLPHELGVEQVVWKTGAHGKPRLAGPHTGWGFNLSHAGTLVVAALTQEGAIGVDVEFLARKTDFKALGERVFSKNEQKLAILGEKEAFFALWSQKEALLKALGCGWANGNIVSKTQLTLAEFQTEPTTKVRVWSRRTPDAAHTLAVAIF